MNQGFAALLRRSRLIDYAFAATIVLVLSVLLVDFKLMRRDQMYADSAMYFQAVENVAARGALVSQVSAGSDDYFFFERALPQDVERNPGALFGGPTTVTERSLFRGHFYVVLYALAQFVRFFPVQTVLMSFYVVSYTGLLLVAYFVLRRKDVPFLAAALFCVLIVSQPAWGLGLLEGQFYPDRLFVFTGFVLMNLAARSDTAKLGRISNPIWMMIVAIACASINERAAIVSGIFLLLHVLLHWQKPGLYHRFRIALGIGLFGYGYGVLKVLAYTNSDYGHFFPNSAELVQLFETPQFEQSILMLLLVSLPLLCLSLFEWRGAIIAATLMLPNIVGNIGGAEKVGWSTHYPSFMLPSLIWAALNGYAVLVRSMNGRKAPLLYASVAGLILFLTLLNPYSTPVSIAMTNAENYSFIPRSIAYVNVFSVAANRESLITAADGILQAVAPHSVVSSVESGTALLYKGRTIRFYPSDLDHADYAVLGATTVNGKVQFTGVVDFHGEAAEEELNGLALTRMRRDGYDVDHPKLFSAFSGLAVVRRVH